MNLNHVNSLHGFCKLWSSDKTQDLTVTVQSTQAYVWELNQRAILLNKNGPGTTALEGGTGWLKSLLHRQHISRAETL